MSLHRFLVVWIINLLPSAVKWKIFLHFNFIQKKLRIDFQQTRSRLFNKPSKIIVIGANDGLSFDDLFQDIHPILTKGFFVEPSKRYYGQLEKNLQNFPYLIPLNIAITNVGSSLPLFQLNDSGLKKMPDWGRGLGSFSKSHLLKFENLTELDLEFENVQGRTFYWLIAEYNLYSVHYLQLDTEGFDAEIIKMIDFTSFFSNMIKFEISNISEFELDEVKTILSTLGYWLVRQGGDMIAYSRKVNPFFY